MPMPNIGHFVPPNLKREFYHGVKGHKGTRHNGLDPYGFSTNGLVLYLPLWALKGSAFKSVDAYKTTATVTTAAWTPTGRDFNKATPDYLEIPASFTTLDFTTGNFSVIFRVKIDSLAAYIRFIQRGIVSTEGYVCQVAPTGLLQFYTSQEGATQETDTEVGRVTTGAWLTLGLTRNGVTIYLYKNGVDITKNQPAITNPASSSRSLKIGVDDTKLLYGMDGLMSDYMIYDRALSVGEHLDIHKRLSWRV